MHHIDEPREIQIPGFQSGPFHTEGQGPCRVRAYWVQTCMLRDGQLHSSGAVPVEASHVSAVAAAEGSHILVAGALTTHM